MIIPFQTIDWSNIESHEHKGKTGTSFWKLIEYDGLRIRMIEYSAGYFADHWCSKGHIVLCLEGEFTSELDNGLHIQLKPGMSYVVSDDASSHRSYTQHGAKLFIVDGEFLK
jgi:quercetin dioxygenase-like cupin family protein